MFQIDRFYKTDRDTEEYCDESDLPKSDINIIVTSCLLLMSIITLKVQRDNLKTILAQSF